MWLSGLYPLSYILFSCLENKVSPEAVMISVISDIDDGIYS